MARRYTARHYEDVAGILRDVLNLRSPASVDHYTVAAIAFQFERMFSADAPGSFDAARFINAVFPEGNKR